MQQNNNNKVSAALPYQEVVFIPHAHSELLKGATVLANAVKSTMGPSGHSVIIDMETGPPLITKDGVTVAKSINLKNRLQSIGAELLKEVASKTNDLAGDGPQPLYSKVLTPKGWKPMGEIKIGDKICGTNNSIQTVLGVYPKGQKTICKVILADGNMNTRIVECSEDHLWSVKTYSGDTKLMTTEQLIASGLERKGGGGKYFIEKTSVEFNNQTDNLPLDPYLLGILLGDGSLSANHEIELSIGLNEEYILDKIMLPKNCNMRTRIYDDKHYIKAVITGSVRKNSVRGSRVSVIKNILNDLGLLGTNSWSKFIPKQYLYSSVENRQKLLNGLIDTDGTISNRGLFTFTTVSKQLNEDFIELCRSLGKSIYCGTINRKKGSGSYSNKPIFRVTELKGNRYGLKVSSIEKTNKQTEMMCIKVSNPDHLYITDNYVATHNTTTATVLGHAMLAEGIKMISTGRSSIDLKKGMDIGTELVISYLKENCIPVSCKEDIVNVGTISANGDRSIGELLAEAIEKVGKDGIITIEPAKSIHTTLQVVEGMQLDAGFVSPFFVTNGDKGTCELDNPFILLTANKISSIQDVVPVLELVHKNNRSLLIIADDIEGEALHTLIVNKMKGTLKICAIKAPSYGEHRADILSDLTTVTGGTVIGSTSEVSLKQIKQEHLGIAKKIIIGRGATTVVGNGTEEQKDAMQKRISDLRSILSNDKSLDALHVDKYRKRLAKLSGGIAVIRVGGSTEVEILEKKDRVEDAVNATLAASQEGIVPGGGTALFYAAQYLRQALSLGTIKNSHNGDVICGIEMIADVCEYPLRTIVDNTGVSPEVVKEKLKLKNSNHKIFYIDVSNANKEDIEEVLEKYKNQPEFSDRERFRFGYNASKGNYTDLVSEGIIDPVKVTRYALEHACSVVGLMLTCNAVIVNEEEKIV